jgi:hypothetical protein
VLHSWCIVAHSLRLRALLNARSPPLASKHRSVCSMSVKIGADACFCNVASVFSLSTRSTAPFMVYSSSFSSSPCAA